MGYCTWVILYMGYFVHGILYKGHCNKGMECVDVGQVTCAACVHHKEQSITVMSIRLNSLILNIMQYGS